MPELLDTQRPGVKPDDQSLLVNVFTVPQCDRTEEGDAFIPPDPKLVRKKQICHGFEESHKAMFQFVSPVEG